MSLQLSCLLGEMFYIASATPSIKFQHALHGSVPNRPTRVNLTQQIKLQAARSMINRPQQDFNILYSIDFPDDHFQSINQKLKRNTSLMIVLCIIPVISCGFCILLFISFIIRYFFSVENRRYIVIKGSEHICLTDNTISTTGNTRNRSSYFRWTSSEEDCNKRSILKLQNNDTEDMNGKRRIKFEKVIKFNPRLKVVRYDSTKCWTGSESVKMEVTAEMKDDMNSDWYRRLFFQRMTNVQKREDSTTQPEVNDHLKSRNEGTETVSVQSSKELCENTKELVFLNSSPLNSKSFMATSRQTTEIVETENNDNKLRGQESEDRDSNVGLLSTILEDDHETSATNNSSFVTTSNVNKSENRCQSV